MSDPGIKAVIADLKSLRFSVTDIARELGCTRQYVHRILRECDLHTIDLVFDQLPVDLQSRIINARRVYRCKHDTQHGSPITL